LSQLALTTLSQPKRKAYTSINICSYKIKRRTSSNMINQYFKINWVECVICVAGFFLITLLSNHFQTRITYNDGKGWDGAFYYTMAQEAANREGIHTDGPYVYRVGLPILAAMVDKSDLLLGFKRANIVFNLSILCLFMLWLMIYLSDWRLRCLLTLMLLMHWLGPLRFISFYPATTDNAQYAFLLLGLIGIHAARTREVMGTILVAITVFIGTFFRETVVLAGFAMIFLGNPIRFERMGRNLAELRFKDVVRLPKPIYFMPMIAGICALICTHLMVHKTEGGYSFLRTAVGWAYDKPILTYVHAVFIVFGPAIVLVIFNWRKSQSFLESNQPFLAFAAAAFVLAYIGGSDTERIMFMAVPVLYILIGKAIEDNRYILSSVPLLLTLCLSQMVSERVFWTIPDFPNPHRTPLPVLTPLSSNFQYLDLFSYFGKRTIEVVSIAEYLLLACVLILWLNNRSQHISAAQCLAGESTNS
jgi:hypothetical protein